MLKETNAQIVRAGWEVPRYTPGQLQLPSAGVSGEKQSLWSGLTGRRRRRRRRKSLRPLPCADSAAGAVGAGGLSPGFKEQEGRRGWAGLQNSGRLASCATSPAPPVPPPPVAACPRAGARLQEGGGREGGTGGGIPGSPRAHPPALFPYLLPQKHPAKCFLSSREVP